MSNDLMKLANSVPADLLSQLQAQAKEERERLGSTGGGDVITVGQNKKFKLPNGQEVDEFDAHIVNFVYRNEYYLGAYNPKNIQPPACFAISDTNAGLAPSENSPMKQIDGDCAGCQQNQFGSSQTGDGKACKNTVMLALVPPGEEVGSHDIWVLKTSPTAIRPFNTYVAKCAEMSLPVASVQTRIFFDPDSTYASVRFEAMAIDADNLLTINGRKESAMARLMVEPDVSNFEPPATK